jgi:hypothetical protein
MPTRHSDITGLFVLIQVDDPIAHDPEFINHVQYGGFCKLCPDFDDENRARARKQEEPLTGKFLIELYTDRLNDFVLVCMPDVEFHRALVCRDVQFNTVDATVVYTYEIMTVGRINSGDDEEEGEEADDEDLPELPANPHQLH